ncbi:MAG: prepilin-type N-terminal cleavage/methylation domain-containing protein [bacterium]
MRFKIRSKKGFTLIELMIVVAIIGILSAVAIPRFADLITKSKEGATKGNLGALRSAVSIYYGDNEGFFPTAITSVDFIGADDYMETIPEARTGDHGDNTGVDEFATEALMIAGYNDDGEWSYGSTTGVVRVDCSHTDKSRAAVLINTW